MLASYAYAYDAADRLVSQVENGATQTFAYDDADQLTAEPLATYAYDANGNRTMAGYATGAGNRLLSDGVWTYTYDAAGNVTKKSQGAVAATWVYTYDHGNRLLTAALSATDGGAATQRVTYAYDAWGDRISRAAWDGTTTTVERYGLDGWDPAKPPAVGTEDVDTWAELDGSNALVTRRVAGPGVNDAVLRATAGGAVTWLLADRQASVRAATDAAGAVTGAVAYDAYGNVTAGALVDANGYAGYAWDATLGMYVLARPYDPATGRFLSADPLGFAAGDASLYRYVGNGPTNATDPSGMYEIPTMLSKLSDKSEDHKKLLELLLDYMDWSLATEVDEGSPTKSAGRGTWRRLNTDRSISIHVTNGWAEKLKAAGHEVKWEHDEWMVDYTNKTIHIDAWSNGSAATYMTSALDAMLKRDAAKEKAASVANGSYLNQFGSNNVMSVGGLPTAADMTQTSADGLADFPGILRQFANHVRNEVVLQLAAPGVLRGSLWLVKKGWQVSRAGNALRFINPARLRAPVTPPRPAPTTPVRPSPPARVEPPRSTTKPPSGTPECPGSGVSSQHGRLTAPIPLNVIACFVAGTPLRTPSGSKPIEQFVPGDVILSRDEDNAGSDAEVRIVEETFVKFANIVNFQLGGKTVETTAEHPFFVQAKGWTVAKDINTPRPQLPTKC